MDGTSSEGYSSRLSGIRRFQLPTFRHTNLRLSYLGSTDRDNPLLVNTVIAKIPLNAITSL